MTSGRQSKTDALASAAGAIGIALLLLFAALPAPWRAALGPAARVPATAASAEALACLAEAIYFESRGEPLAGRVGVAHVVLNRAQSRRYPDDVCAVIREGERRGRGRCQFSYRCDGLAESPADRRAWAEAERLARDVLEGRHPDPTGGALWYHAGYVTPTWSAGLRKTARLGNHVYYR